VRPLMRFVWLGAIFMACGGFLATLDRRYRRRREAAEEAAATSLVVSTVPGGAA
jgi:cytochrome c-type biogenesis protein CcmF